jgi:cardiolipin synthase
MLQQFELYWHWIVLAISIVVGVVASVHVILNKRESVSAIAWVGMIWLVPIFGGLLYWAFGINRIKRRAISLRRHHRRSRIVNEGFAELDKALVSVPASEAEHLRSLARLIDNVTSKPLLSGNRIRPLVNGDAAYPEMLRAIDEARQTITLCTYIFEKDSVGQQFIDALHRAVVRGVEVRVLIDDIGAHYCFPTVVGRLRRAGVRVALFLPKLVPGYSAYANLCNHRKVLVIDGRIGFSGGMNLSAGNVMTSGSRHLIQDVHFRIEGPVVAHVQEAFADDWLFTTREVLRGDAWFPTPVAAGNMLARGVGSGPDDDFEKLWMTLIGALGCANHTVRIVTPYFLPDSALIAALNAAAMRGVKVDIILPEQNNLRTVQWASTALLPQLLEHGCRVWLTAPPFDHSKLVLIDGVWTLLGSANWDPRSFRLNFEFDIECYDLDLARILDELIRHKLVKSKQVTLADVNNRSFLVKLRDGVARLLTPYL